MIIALASNKGGVGKTTLALNLAGRLALDGTTVLVDADPQQSSTHWATLADKTAAFKVAPLGVPSAVKRLAQEFEHMVFDCPPSIEHPDTQVAIRFADTILIPVLPSPLDLWATLAVAEAVPERIGAVAVVLNQVEPRTRLTQDAETILDQLNLASMDTRIHRRVAYRNAILDGRTVDRIGRSGEAARLEMDALYQELTRGAVA